MSLPHQNISDGEDDQDDNSSNVTASNQNNDNNQPFPPSNRNNESDEGINNNSHNSSAQHQDESEDDLDHQTQRSQSANSLFTTTTTGAISGRRLHHHQNNNSNTSGFFALQNPNSALNAPSRRTTLFCILLFCSFVFYLVGSFQSLVDASSSDQAKKFFAIIDRPLSSSSSSITTTTSSPQIKLQRAQEDKGYRLTIWQQCYTNFTIQILTPTSYRIDATPICSDPSSAANFCPRAQSLVHASRAFQTFALITCFIGGMIGVCSFCGARSVAKYSRRLNFGFVLAAASFGLIAFGISMRIASGGRVCATSSSDGWATAILEAESEDGKKIFQLGKYLPLTLTAIILNVVGFVLCFLTEVSWLSEPCGGSERNAREEREDREMRRGRF